MRLPYLQVAQEAFTKARLLATMVQLERTDAMGRVMDLWAWALDMGPEDEAPTGLVEGPHAPVLIAAAMGWEGDAGKLVEALVAVGLLERTAEGFRVRGFSRYKRTWEKNRRRQPKGANAPEVPETGATGAGNRQEPARSVPETGRNPAPPAPEPARQTQTQTQSFFEEEGRAADASSPTSPKPDGAGEEKRPRKLRQHTAQPTPEGLEHKALCEALDGEYRTLRGEAYPGFTTEREATAVAVKTLRKLRQPGTPPEAHLAEVVRRWRFALTHPVPFHRLDRLPLLAGRWGSYGPGGAAETAAAGPPGRRGADSPFSNTPLFGGDVPRLE